jgi:ABC-type bacteriocin/lantibiotic exporter with double-glycine peptidase domain
VRIVPGQLFAVRPPAIAHLSDGHYVVVFEVSLQGVVLGDPARGIERRPLLEFFSQWTGHLLLITRG